MPPISIPSVISSLKSSLKVKPRAVKKARDVPQSLLQSINEA
ncbi:hypothetical protein [Candidatus Palauibacter sp.]